ncbi:phosphoglycerate mutase family protein [Rhodohalobacter mucosus]|uniref:Phosphoglycerate mutase n=1 Tax=Rhodohalobacter mucosus TaxID=2079485 RepID=A0A316U1H1_9BACT|nr:phosphoglycerate mutase family protein [Rhodohalobacter mucosus]PWN06786.1 phosphoglycerate mutase [Rhodohalobacter mucosus]
MNRTSKSIVAISLFCLLFPLKGNAQEADNISTFILVRHAEKEDNSRDPDLSQEGYERAERLAKMLAEIDFDAVYSTPYIRTRETARPLAENNGLELSEYDPGSPDETVPEWRSLHRGDIVLISGHSNTTPAFANALLGREHFKETFDESDYGNLLIITITPVGEARLLHLRY